MSHWIDNRLVVVMAALGAAVAAESRKLSCRTCCGVVYSGFVFSTYLRLLPLSGITRTACTACLSYYLCYSTT